MAMSNCCAAGYTATTTTTLTRAHARAAPVALVGGPLDGLLLDVTGWTPDQIAGGAALSTELGRFGAGGRALYDPRPGDPSRFDWSGDSP